MEKKPNILQKSSEQQRNVIITILIIIIFACIAIILYFMFYKEKEVKLTNRMPFVELYGDTNIVLNEHDSFVEYGYYAYDLEDGNLTKKISIQSDLDVNKPGIYTLTYVANDSGKQSAVKTRTVVVKSADYKFDFELKGSKLILLKKGNRFTEPGYMATDGTQNLTEAVKVLGEVNGEEEGIYTLYYVCEHNHEVALEKRLVIVSSTLNNASLSDDDLEYISNYNIKELKNNYKIIPEHFSSKTMLFLAFSLCQNEGALDDNEVSSCLDKTFELKNREISHQTYYDLLKGNISFNQSDLKWNVSTSLLANQLENNLMSLKNSMRLAMEDDKKLYVFVEDDEYMYKYTFLKQDDRYLFTSVDVL